MYIVHTENPLDANLILRYVDQVREILVDRNDCNPIKGLFYTQLYPYEGPNTTVLEAAQTKVEVCQRVANTIHAGVGIRKALFCKEDYNFIWFRPHQTPLWLNLIWDGQNDQTSLDWSNTEPFLVEDLIKLLANPFDLF